MRAKRGNGCAPSEGPEQRSSPQARPGPAGVRRRVTTKPPGAGIRAHPARTGRPDSVAYWISRRGASPRLVHPGAQRPPRWRGRNRRLASRLHPAVKLVRPGRRPAETPAYLERAPAEARSLARGKSRSPRPPPPSSQVSEARGGPGRPGSAPASPFSSDAFDPRVLRRTSARELPGSARGDPGNRPRFISFHQAALGSLETAEPVIAFFRRPGADWITANQRLVYT